MPPPESLFDVEHFRTRTRRIAVAREVGNARLVVQNGVGYDAFMNTIESAAPSSGRTVINVQQLLQLPDSTPNPHLWYDPATMPQVADAIAADLAAVQPSHKAYFAFVEMRRHPGGSLSVAPPTTAINIARSPRRIAMWC